MNTQIVTQFVSVCTDGPVYRWRRQARSGVRYTSNEAFATIESAIQAAQWIAHSYRVPLLRSVDAPPTDTYVPFQHSKEYYNDVQPDYMREDWIGE